MVKDVVSDRNLALESVGIEFLPADNCRPWVRLGRRGNDDQLIDGKAF